MIQRMIEKRHIICFVGLFILLTLFSSCQNYENKELVIIKQNFTWGILAINTYKSVYFPNETAEIGIAVLDDEGRMVCDADVTLEITDANNIKTILTTPNDIIVTKSCDIKDLTSEPDYYATYRINTAGTYSIKLIAVTNAGTWSMEDNFIVTENIDFEVERQHWTRVYPAKDYLMNISVKANKDYKGIIFDYVPASFEISGEGFTVTENIDEKVISWDVDLKKNDEINLVYEIDYPYVSPEFYLIGKLDIGSWHEARYWQIASDATSLSDTGIAANDTTLELYETVKITSNLYCTGAGGIDFDVWMTDDGTQIDTTQSGRDFYCEDSTKVSVTSCTAASCSVLADCSVRVTTCDNKDVVDIEYIFVANQASSNLLKAGGTAGTFDNSVSITVTSPNSPPTLTTIAYEPTSPNVTNNITFNTTVSDVDTGDSGSLAVYCEMYNNSVFYAKDTFSNLANGTVVNCTVTPGNLTKGEQWGVNMTPYDGTLNGTLVASAKVTVANSAPNLTSISYTPTSPNALSNLTFNTTVTDVDIADSGSLIVYCEIYNNSVFYKKDTFSNLANGTVVNCTITPGNTTKGEQWSVNMTAYDGTVNSTLIASAEVTVVSIAPTISNIETISAVTLSAGTTKEMNVLFNTTDPDGANDINESTANATVFKTGETNRYNWTCTKVSQQDDTTRFNCSILMYFYDGDGTWTVNVSIQDNSEVWGINQTVTFTVNTLDDVDIDDTTINWASLAPNSNDNEGDAITFTDKGNQDYASINVTGANATSGNNNLNATYFSVDVDTGQTTGQTYLNETTLVWTGASLNHGAAVTEVMYPYVDVPSGQPSGTYTSVSNWNVVFIT